MSDNLTWLQEFYLSLCDGDWEHSYGFKIDNCDNPGWLFEFELTDTGYEDAGDPNLKYGADLENDGSDWLHLRKQNGKILGACGPLKLDELLGEFRTWVARSDTERSKNAPNN